MKLRHGLFAIDSKYKKNKKYVDDESDLDDDAVADHEETMKALQIEKAQKKFAKDNEKLLIEGEQPQVDSVLKEKIKDIEEEFKRLKKERGTGRAAFKRERPAEKIEDAIEKLDEKIKTFKLQMVDREAGKEVALGTRYARANSLMPCTDAGVASLVRSIIWILGMLMPALSDIRIFIFAAESLLLGAENTVFR